MNKKIKIYLQLMRVSLVFTALSNVGCGYLLARRGEIQGGELVLLLGISFCLYTGGMVLNDLADFDRDKELHPSRPLPSGQVTFRETLFLFLLLAGTGLGMVFGLSRERWLFGIGTLLSILAYDLAFKRIAFIGPLIMALCRLFNFAMGEGGFSWPAFIVFSYTAFLTYLSLLEEEWRGTKYLWTLPLWGGMALVGVGPLLPFPNLWWMGLIPLLGLLCWVALRLKKAKTPRDTGLCIRDLILGFILLDTALLAGWTGRMESFFWVAWLLPPLAVLFYKKRGIFSLRKE